MNDKTILDAVALTERGYNSTLKDYKIMLEKGAEKVMVRHYEDDNLLKEEYFK